MSLHDLIRNEKVDEIIQLLKAQPDEILNKEDEFGRTPLHTAVVKGNLQIIQLLLDSNVNIINVPDASGDTPFQYACLKDDGSIIMRLLSSYGANVNHLDSAGASCLFNTILQVNGDDFNSNYNSFNKAKLLLELGANCHVSCFGQTLLELIEEKNLSVEWWTLLIDNGIGLFCDFSRINIDVDLLRQITANQVMIAAVKNGKLVDRDTPGFEEAIINEEVLMKALRDGNIYNFKALIISSNHLIKDNQHNLKLIKCLNQLNELIKSFLVKSGQVIAIDKLIKCGLFEEAKKRMPPDLVDNGETREKQLQQQIMRGGALN